MWVSIILAVVTYLLSPKDTAAQRRKALLKAAAVGGASYMVTENTDWGKDISNSFDNMIGVGDGDKPIGEKGEGSAAELVDKDKVTSVTKPKKVGNGTSGFWNTLTSWGAAGTAAVIGTAGVATGAVPDWLIVAGLGLVVLLVLK